MTQDDRHQPHRATNSLMLNQVGQPSPDTVLAAVLTLTDNTTPTQIAAIPEWGDAASTWRVVGCTDRVLFEVTAHKAVRDWYGGGLRATSGDEESLTARAVPLSSVTGVAFELSEVWRSDVGDPGLTLHGTWRIACGTGVDLELPTYASNHLTRQALASIAQTALAAVT